MMVESLLSTQSRLSNGSASERRSAYTQHLEIDQPMPRPWRCFSATSACHFKLSARKQAQTSLITERELSYYRRSEPELDPGCGSATSASAQPRLITERGISNTSSRSSYISIDKYDHRQEWCASNGDII